MLPSTRAPTSDGAEEGWHTVARRGEFLLFIVAIYRCAESDAHEALSLLALNKGPSVAEELKRIGDVQCRANPTSAFFR